MAFKKSKGKGGGGKKKVKKSRGKRDEWSHEGGVVLDGKDEENQDNNGKRKRRTTQDREESIRRSKLKNNDRKRKIDFQKKMSKKVKFGDVVKQSQSASASENESDTSDGERARPREVRLNPLPVMDRLQVFLAKSLQARHGGSDSGADDDSGREDGAEGSEGDESEYDEEDDSDAREEGEYASGDDAAVDDCDVNDEELESDGGSSDDDSQADGKRSSRTQKEEFYFERMFQSDVAAPEASESAKLTRLGAVPDAEYEIYGKLNFQPTEQQGKDGSALPLGAGPYSSVAQVPGLHKLFRGSAASSRIDAKVFSAPGVNSHLLPYLVTYADTFLEGRDYKNDAHLMQGALLHAVSHTVKARAKVIRHNQKLKKKLQNSLIAAAVASDGANKSAKKKNKAAPVAAEASNADDAEVMRDQGFCRPRLLILCPYRSTALRIVQTIRTILGENTSISGWDKLVDEYSPPPDEDDDKADQAGSRKPDDWKALFHQQNVDDDFKMGIQLNPGHGKGSGAAKGVYMRLFSDFFISDIILASPIGLRLAIGAPVKDKKASKDKKDKKAKTTELSPDFLSSVEMVMLHQADVMLMQNWEHLDYVMRQTNKLPTAAHDTDYSRVRQYFLEGQAAQHRQLIVSSHFNDPELQAFFRAHAASLAGQVRLKKDWGKGQLSRVVSGAKQVFQLVPGVRDFESQEDARFRYFKESVLAPVLRLEQKHTLIVTPSYLHYVRVRNELLAQEANAAFVCEYSRDSEISRGRSRFFHGVKDIMLYSGRAHFFRRFHIRGARQVIFYSLPEFAEFYSEIVNMLSTQTGEKLSATDEMVGVSCLVLYTQYERMALERIVGAKRCAQMIAGAKATFMFT